MVLAILWKTCLAAACSRLYHSLHDWRSQDQRRPFRSRDSQAAKPDSQWTVRICHYGDYDSWKTFGILEWNHRQGGRVRANLFGRVQSPLAAVGIRGRARFKVLGWVRSGDLGEWKLDWEGRIGARTGVGGVSWSTCHSSGAFPQLNSMEKLWRIMANRRHPWNVYLICGTFYNNKFDIYLAKFFHSNLVNLKW